MRSRLACVLLVWLLVAPTWGQEVATRRFLLAVGANNGGVQRQLLRYAVDDAESFARVLRDMGGVDTADCMVLRDPDLTQFDSGLLDLQRRVRAASRWGGGRLEVVVYYSGHADEHGLLLGGRRKSYAEFRRQLRAIPATVRLAVVDACASGSMTRVKGGTRQRPFLLDASSDMRGSVFLTSSAASEAAQESDRIHASFFTHYLVSGLRGAADVSGDGRVTLDEAYRFSFAETLARTTGTQGGAQHPSREIRLAGTGDLVLTELRRTAAGLRLGVALSGRFFVRDAQQRLVAELRKPPGRVMELGLETGAYSVLWEDDARFSTAQLEVAAGDRRELREDAFVGREREPTITRGDGGRALTVGISDYLNLDIATRRHTVSLGLFLNYQEAPFRGVQAAWLVNQARAGAGTQVSMVGNLAQAEVRGWQLSGMVNWAVGAVQGQQLAGGLNIARQLRGWQLAGSTNVAAAMRGVQLTLGANFVRDIAGVQVGPVNVADHIHGWQVGLVNVSGDIDGVSLGLVNYSHTGLFNLSLWHDDLGFSYMTLRSGSRAFYTTLCIGREFPGDDGLTAVGLGLGSHRDQGRAFLEFELEHLAIMADPRSDRNQLTRVRMLFGHRVDRQLSLVCGMSLNQLVTSGDPLLVHPWGRQHLNLDDDVLFWPGVFVGMRLGRQ